LIRRAGEEQVAIALLRSGARKANALLGSFALEQDLIVLTTSRLILHTTPEPHSVVKSTALNLPSKSSNRNDSIFLSRTTNNDMLDLDAMDKMLDSIDNIKDQQNPAIGARITRLSQQSSQVPVIDIDVASPTMPKSSKSKLVINRGAASETRTLFE